MTEIEQPSQNGMESALEEDANKARPADIEQDMREMERRKRVEAIMGSKLFREELERIVDSQIREGGSSGILQQLSDIVGIPTSRIGNVFKSSNCVLPINDIRGVESMGYSKGEKILRCKLGASFRLLDVYGWSNGLGAQITARLKVDQELFLVNPYGLLYHEVTASSLNKVDMQGNVVEQGTTNFGVNKNHFMLHSVVHAARPDIRCIIYIGCNPVVAISSLKVGILPLTYDSVVLGEVSTHQYTGCLSDTGEREKLVRNLGPVSKVILLTNYGALCCGETIEEAFFAAQHMVQACETQLKLLPLGVDNLVLIPEESRKTIYDAARRPPEDIVAAFEKKLNLGANTNEDASTADESQTEIIKDPNHKSQPKWRVGGAEFEALMRMLDNAGFRTGYIYRHPLIKSELPKPKNDVELPPAVSSLGYLLEEEELYRQGIWKKGDWRKGGDRSRWLNSPNVYQKVEVLETGTPDPKKITKWVADGSPTHSTPVRIEGALQFVPTGTNSKEFKKVQQQIKDNRRADKISAGPQSHILEGVTWDEANRIKDATVSSTGDHVVLMGAASKGIIQRGFQHNATVYKAPYAKNPFDNVTDDELNEYKRTIEKKKNVHGEYTDTDFSESEALSSLQTSGAQQNNSSKVILANQSENEDVSDHHVMRIETKQAPVPSQPEVVLSDAQESKFIYTRHKPPPQVNQENTNLFGFSDVGVSYQCGKSPLTKNKALEQQNTQLKPNVCSDFKLKLTSEPPSEIKTFSNYAFGELKNATKKFPTSKGNVLESDSKPFRTCSHFGYNYPRLENIPKHYHIPKACNMFNPVKKHSSLSEVFSGPKYFDLCNMCFAKLAGIRSNFFRRKISLRSKMNTCDQQDEILLNHTNDSHDEENIVDLFQLHADSFNVSNDSQNEEKIVGLFQLHADSFNVSNDSQNEEKIVDLFQLHADSFNVSNDSQNEEQIVGFFQLHADSFNSQFSTQVLGLTPFYFTLSESSDFSDKIARMNYSEESSIIDFQPYETITSEIQQSFESMENASNENILETNTLPLMNSANIGRKLMSRQERNQRKYVFSELWEDHIQFYGTRPDSDSEGEAENTLEVYFGQSFIQTPRSVRKNTVYIENALSDSRKAPSWENVSYSDEDSIRPNVMQLKELGMKYIKNINTFDSSLKMNFSNIKTTLTSKPREYDLSLIESNKDERRSLSRTCVSEGNVKSSIQKLKHRKYRQTINLPVQVKHMQQFSTSKLSHSPRENSFNQNNNRPFSPRQTKRNFIAENIRNASVPHRHQNISKVAKVHKVKPVDNSISKNDETLSPKQLLNNSKQTSYSKLLKRPQNTVLQCKTKVDTEIDALCQQIDALKPLNDHFSKKICNLGKNVFKTSKMIDFVFKTQNECQQLRKNIYTEKEEENCLGSQPVCIFEIDD